VLKKLDCALSVAVVRMNYCQVIESFFATVFRRIAAQSPLKQPASHNYILAYPDSVEIVVSRCDGVISIPHLHGAQRPAMSVPEFTPIPVDRRNIASGPTVAVSNGATIPF
jgi:hypothetical protein